MRRTSLTRQLPAAGCVAAVALFAASPAIAGADHGRGEGPLVAYADAIPAGASAKVTAVYDATGRSTVTLHVRGLQPNTEYGAHAHVKGCSLTDPLASGGHYQHTIAPAGQSTDPAYANPRNEIWLDLTTNAAGNGVARAVVPWQFGSDRPARSVVLHERHTSTAPGQAGTAGARLACLDVDF
jgi:Cu-Zn family superoxide dismutase